MKNNQQKITMLQDLGMLYPTETSKQKSRYGLYKCFCGKEFKTFVKSVKIGNTKSCGCLKIKHNLTSNRIYKIWHSMLLRCNNIQNKAYKDYGARGISVCDRWHNIANFIEDMHPAFQEGLTLDRINPNGNYEPSNCRWTTKTTQARNTRTLQINNTSGYRCVSYRKDKNKYLSQIKVNSKKIYLGYYNTKLEAAKAYDQYVIDNNLEHTLNFKKVQCK